MSLANFYNGCWMAACYREACAYDRDSKIVRQAQAAVLRQCIERHRDTWFGRKHGFDRIRDVRDYQNAVPLSGYDGYRDPVERIAEGEQNVLTRDRVRLLEPTGGSTSGEKLIPFTSPLALSFHRAIRVWIWNLYSQRPAVRRGRSYWSITPLAHRGRRTKAGIPIGFNNDAQYLSQWERYFAQKTIIAPPQIAHMTSVAAAQYATLFFLLRARDLSLISVWSPTFLTELLQLLWTNREQLANDVATGRISVDAAGKRDSVSQQAYRPLKVRADELHRIFRSVSRVSECISAIWPSLALVSCWADGPSRPHADRLREYLPGIEVQPKGLLATEAFVSVPLVDCAAPALAIRSHFFEFQPIHMAPDNGDTSPMLADELVAGECYRVIVTTQGGLYRYQLHDEVKFVGFKHQVPLLRFVGKTDNVSDIVGEKLQESHVDAVLQAVFREVGLRPTFSQLRVQNSSSPGYVLQITATGLADDQPLQARVRRAVENGLEASPGYHYARATGQLRPLQIDLLDQREADAITARRVAARVSVGQRLGNIKPTSLRH